MAEDEDAVKSDASPDCTICKGDGWHWGWNEHQEPVMLRCPCVDRNRETQPRMLSARMLIAKGDSRVLNLVPVLQHRDDALAALRLSHLALVATLGRRGC